MISEKTRQETTLDLIPSENVAQPEMLGILGSPLVNKYSEGYPGARYYPGNEFCDEIELLAKERALSVFGVSGSLWNVNVQPYSGSPANQAIYFALARSGDTIMGLSLAHGGHLTHGHHVSFSGKQYRSNPYGVDLKSGLIDYDELKASAFDAKPKIIFSGSSAYPRQIDFEKIGSIAREVQAYHVADISHIAGLVATGLHPSPFPYADVVMTTMHKTLRGPRGAVIFSRNKDMSVQNENGDSEEHVKTISEAIDRAVFPGLQGGPHNNVTAAIAWAFSEAMGKKFKSYMERVVKNAKVLSEELSRLGFELIAGGTDTHLMLINLKSLDIGGADAEKMLEWSHILANRNSIPGDAHPRKPSGIRLGTPSLTSRGMKEKEMKQVALLIHRVLVGKETVKDEVKKLCKKFPLPYKGKV